jgi:hypothetical protein
LPVAKTLSFDGDDKDRRRGDRFFLAMSGVANQTKTTDENRD